MSLRAALLALLLLLIVPSPALAQWFTAVYLGANHTQRSAVTIQSPANGLDVTFHDVEFAAEPFRSPQYYGIRIGRMTGAARRVGLEVEFIHLKVIAETGVAYAADGVPEALRGLPMSAVVERYSMTHGLNFLVVNLISRTPLGSRPIAVVLRAGAGPTLPHAESSVLGRTQEQYEYAGLGAHAAAGLDIRLRGRWSVDAEYKFTYARPRIELADGGAGRMRAATHQFAFGIALGLW